jgi:hypothetical protein
LFHRLDREETIHYLDRRAEQGFTLIQAVVLAELDGLRTPNAYGEVPLLNLNPETPNERYFQHVDWVIAQAAVRGLYVGLLPTWGDKVPSAHPASGPIVFTPRNAEAYGRFLGASYRNAPVVWILGGDRNVDSSEALEIWRAMARGLREGDQGRHLITYHPRGEASSSATLHNEPWLDFNLFQSGHARRFNPVHRYVSHDRLLHPPKPTLDAEPAYEDIPVAFWEFIAWDQPQVVPESVLDSKGNIREHAHFAKGFFSDYDVRVHAYWNFLSGSCGYTYGNNAVWQMFAPGRRPAIPCLADWRSSLERAGANQIRHLRALFERISLASLQPDQSLVYGPNPEGPGHIRAAGCAEGRYAAFYLPRGDSVPVVMGKVRGEQVDCRWFNPRTGEFSAPQRTENAGIRTFTPPSSNEHEDWLLLIEKKPHD